jgi:hypothetical protein
MFEFVALGVRRPVPRQQSMRMLASDAQLPGKIGDGQSFAAQQRLPDLGFGAHGRRS